MNACFKLKFSCISWKVLRKKCYYFTSCTCIKIFFSHLFRCGRRRFLQWYKRFRRKRRREEYGPTSFTLRRTRRSSSQPPGPIGSWSSRRSSRHRRSSASLSNGGNRTHPAPEMAVLQVPFAESPQAPCASPEISDVDLMGSPRKPHQPSFSGSDYIFSAESSGKMPYTFACFFCIQRFF